MSFLKTLLSVLLTVTITGLIIWIYFETKISKITFTPEFTAQDVNVHDTTQIANSPRSKVAIALFGLDARY
nr:hypothetical protein [Fervidobacterium pennivorans]